VSPYVITRCAFLTQKERDDETSLDYFLARYYSSSHGRFTSPDEFSGGPDELFDFADAAAENPTFYADLENPQSLNKYQYCYNNPLAYIDPDGHCPDCDERQRRIATGVGIGAAVGAVVGGIVGGAGGATAGGTVGVVGGPPGVVIGVVAGGGGGGTLGSLKGAAVGGLIGGFLGAAYNYVVGPSSPSQTSTPPSQPTAQPQTTTPNTKAQPQPPPPPVKAEHTKGKRPSTKPKHDIGKARKKKERDFTGNRIPRKPNHDHLGPWPPKPAKPGEPSRPNPCPTCKPKWPRIEPK
jgi:RHS repeat-associated protein